MKKTILLLLITILSIAAKAQVPSCPGTSTQPSAFNFINNTNCDVKVSLFEVNRNGCIGTANPYQNLPSTIVPAGGSSSISLAWIPGTFYNALGSHAQTVVMANINWDNDQCSAFGVSVQSPGPGTSWPSFCWSCGLYVAPGSGAVQPMPNCNTCDGPNTAHIEWNANGDVVIQP